MRPSFFTARPTWCKDCAVIDSADALKPVAALRQMLADGSAERVAGEQDPVELLVRARSRPKCGSCQHATVWLSTIALEAGRAPCPRCTDGTLAAEQTLLWD